MSQFDQEKKLIISPFHETIATGISGTSISSVANYGTWDGSGFWIGGTNGTINRINPLVTGYFTKTGFDVTTPGKGGNPLQMDFDGRYLWVGDYDAFATFFKYDTAISSTVASGKLFPSGPGLGGIQGVIYDGSSIWFGAPDVVLKLNPTTLATGLIVSGQFNVNGLSKYTDPSGQGYILAACNSATTGFWSKINANTGAYTTYTSQNFFNWAGYRICNDGTYAYIAFFSSPGIVEKYRLSDGAWIAQWNAGQWLNSINYNSGYLWMVGDNYNVDVTDVFGNHSLTLSGNGRSDVVLGGGYAWSVFWSGNASNAKVYSTPLSNALNFSPSYSGVSGYKLRVHDLNGNPTSGSIINEGYNGGNIYGNPAGRYILKLNGFVAAKADFPSGIGINNVYVV